MGSGFHSFWLSAFPGDGRQGPSLSPPVPSSTLTKIFEEDGGGFNGAVPADSSKVKVNYKGTLIDGTEFDSSYKRNEPATFRANQVIKGLSLIHISSA